VSTETTVPVLLPSLGESVTEATIVEWLKQPGDPIALDEEIVEVTSDKADLRIPSPAAGVLARIVAQPGETIEIGDILCELSEDGAAPSANGGGAAPVAAPPPTDAEIADIILPSLGESVTEATIVEWIKGIGEAVALDEEIVEITSDKADLRVPSPFAGALTEIVAQPGDTIDVGGLLARIAVARYREAAEAHGPD
jgi:2-oxoglutarate dehydrogenase E2 component (dihydrolipoamide succinyltransferase)